jgi:hypothetical protein
MVVASDIMHMNGMTFLVTISRHLRFATTELLKKKEKQNNTQGNKKCYKHLQRRKLSSDRLVNGWTI